MSRLTLVAAAATLAALAASFAGCDWMPGKPKAHAVEVRPDKVENFGVLYAENCSGCHGPNGKGGAGAIGLADPGYLAIADDAAIRHATANGVPGTQMSAFARESGGMLTAAQVEVLVSGIRGWAKTDALGGATPPPYAASPSEPGDAAQGAAVYTKFCASCHGEAGRGGPKAGSIVDGSYLGLVSNQSLRTTVIAGRPELGQPDWRNDVAGEALTARDVSDVVAWLAAQRPSTPGQPYPEKTP